MPYHGESEEKGVPGICLPGEKAQCPLREVILDPEAFLFGESPEVFGHDTRVDLGEGADRDECFHGGGLHFYAEPIRLLVISA
jgi:hypothetical protein